MPWAGRRALTRSLRWSWSGGEGEIDAQARERAVGAPTVAAREYAGEFGSVFGRVGGNRQRENEAAVGGGGDDLREFVGDIVVVGEEAQVW